MHDDPRVQELLDELHESHATPEAVCALCPELLPVVRKRWRRIRRLRADLDALFPLPAESDGATALNPDPSTLSSTDLPQIPGYEVEAVLARGGMAVVFKARHQRLNRPVALKMLLAGAYAGREELARFRREAEAVAALRHPNIVQVHDAGEVTGRPYFTMEYVEGGTLSHSLAGQPHPPRRAAELAATLASAVQFAHQSGFIHRDLKPANVLLTEEDVPKISDFGLARSIVSGPEVTRSGDFLGTPCYMAPEQARGHAGAVGPAADIYALGAVLYEVLTGRPPLEGETAAETVQKVISEEPAPPSRLNAQVPCDLETICLKCLQKSPARRYASAQDLADDLHRFLDGKPVLARPVGLAERAVKWARRRPAVALLVGALLVLGGATVGTGVWLHQQEGKRREAKDQRERQARDAIQTALKRANDLGREERWREALVVLKDAAPHLGDASSPSLAESLRQARSDYRIADRLERARENYPLLPDGAINYRQRARDFLRAFAQAGLTAGDDVETAAASVRASRIRAQLVAALEDRAFVAFMLGDQPLVERSLRVARLADPGSPWRDRFRRRATWRQHQQLQELAATAFTSAPPPSGHQLALLALLLRPAGAWGQGVRLLREACRRQPRNFWVHREMGFTLAKHASFQEAAGFYRVAISLRPDNAGAHEGLGLVLSAAGRWDEAIAAFRQAVQAAPHNGPLRARLVQALAKAGYWKDAETVCRRALAVDPANHLAPLRLVAALFQHDRAEDALILARQAARIAPRAGEAQAWLGAIFRKLGQRQDAVRATRRLARLRAYHFADKWLAEELVATGRWQEALTVLQKAAAREPRDYLWPCEAGKVFRAHGKPAEAARAFRKATTLDPRFREPWEGLAAAALDLGRFAEARAATERLLRLYAKETRRRAQRRQLALCNALLPIAPDLPAILAGKGLPAQASTRRALAEWCLKHKRLTTTAAAFYEAAFAAQPSLAEDGEDRLAAARAAALAGCGVGADAGKLGSGRRASLRRQALGWLTAEYNALAQRHRTGKPGDRTAAATAVRSWQRHKDLAGVRDGPALARLPEGERRAWQALWAKVAALAARNPDAKRDQARAYAARGEWKKAAGCYAERMKLEPTDDGEVWFEYAAAQLLAGDRAGYRRTCGHMVARCQPAGPMRPYLVARACTLAVGSTEDPRKPLLLSSFELDRGGAEFWALTERGALGFRTGGGAVAYLERSLAADGRPPRAVLNWLWLALCHQEEGSPKEARRWLDKAARWLDQQGGRMPLVPHDDMGWHLHNWLEAYVLRREAAALLR
jgi:serine/threonine-protein kinase